jgi:hypothetical protein
MVLPYTLWVVAHRHAAFASTTKFKLTTTTGWLQPLLEGLQTVVVAVPAILGPLALIYLLVFRKAPSVRQPQSRSIMWRRVLERSLLLIAGIVLILIVAFKRAASGNAGSSPFLFPLPFLGFCS